MTTSERLYCSVSGNSLKVGTTIHSGTGLKKNSISYTCIMTKSSYLTNNFPWQTGLTSCKIVSIEVIHTLRGSTMWLIKTSHGDKNIFKPGRQTYRYFIDMKKSHY